MNIKTRYGRSCLSSMSAPYLLCIWMIFNYCVPAILACTICERLMRFHCPFTWAWWDIDAKKKIISDAETSNLPTRKLQQVNALHVWNMKYKCSFKKDIRLHFNCEIYFPVHIFLHLQTGEMPSCGISSGYALFVKVKKDLSAKKCNI